MERVNNFVDFRTELIEEGLKTTEIEQEESSTKRASDELEQEVAKKQKEDDNQEAAKMQELMKIVPDEEELAITTQEFSSNAKLILLLSQLYGEIFCFITLLALSISQYVITKVIEQLMARSGMDMKMAKTCYHSHSNGSSKKYFAFIQMLGSFNKEDLETLWKLVKAKHGSTRLEEGYERVHCLMMQSRMIYILVERRYPHTVATITDMLNKKLQVDNFSEMAY
ncbi:hypothetical protein Tco_0489210 [Tanacetum coccineum]